MADFAKAIRELLDDPVRGKAMGRAGRHRAIDEFSWAAIAQRTVEIYRSVL